MPEEREYVNYVKFHFPNAVLHHTFAYQFGERIDYYRIESDYEELSVTGLTSLIAWQNAADKIFIKENNNA